jgi:hypothetical protein
MTGAFWRVLESKLRAVVLAVPITLAVGLLQ